MTSSTPLNTVRTNKPVSAETKNTCYKIALRLSMLETNSNVTKLRMVQPHISIIELQASTFSGGAVGMESIRLRSSAKSVAEIGDASIAVYKECKDQAKGIRLGF